MGGVCTRLYNERVYIAIFSNSNRGDTFSTVFTVNMNKWLI